LEAIVSNARTAKKEDWEAEIWRDALLTRP
jgi:hypothetical protein